MLTRRHLPLLIALLLPLLMLRAMLPDGYMPLAQAGELRLVLCSEGLQQAGGGAPDPAHPEPADGGNCVFADAAFKAPPPLFLVSTELPAWSGQILPFTTADQHPATGPPRSTSARAPPANS